MKRILAWFLALIMVFGMVSLPKMTKAEGEENPDQPGSVEEIPNEEEGKKGGEIHDAGSIPIIDKLTLYLGWEGHEAAELTTKLSGDVTWSSDDESVATVAGAGNTAVVTGVAAGSATITATSGEKAEKWDVVVEQYVAAGSVTLNKSSLELTVTIGRLNEYETLTATVAPDNATFATVTWSSSDASIATVDQEGKVTAVAEGNATITATTEDGQSASCAVSVIKRHVTGLHWNNSKDNACLNYMWVGREEVITAYMEPTGGVNYVYYHLYDPTCSFTLTDADGNPSTDVVEIRYTPNKEAYVQNFRVIPKGIGTAYLTVTPNDTATWDGTETAVPTLRVPITVVAFESGEITIRPSTKYVDRNTRYYQTITATIKYDGGKTANISKAVHVSKQSGDSANIVTTQQPYGWEINTTNVLGTTTIKAYVGPNSSEALFQNSFKVVVVEDASLYASGIQIDPCAIWLDEANTATLTANLTPDTAIYAGNVTGKDAWTSNDESIVTVAGGANNTATVTAVGPIGHTSVKAISEEGYTSSGTVYVLNADLFDYAEGYYPPTEAMLLTGTKEIRPILEGVTGNGNSHSLRSPFTIESRDQNIVSVDDTPQGAVLTANGTGTATITVSFLGRQLHEFSVRVLSGKENLGASNDPDALFESKIHEVEDGVLADLPIDYKDWANDNYPVLLDEHYANYFFYGYCDENGTIVADRNKATHAKFMTKDLLKIGIQFRFTPIEGDPDQVTDVRFITTIAERAEGVPQTFTAIGFLVKVEDNTTPAANHTFSKPFYKEIRGDYKPVDINQWAKGISQMFALQTVTGMPNAFFEDEGTVLHVNAIFITLDGTTINGPVKNIRVLYDENGNKTATPDQGK